MTTWEKELRAACVEHGDDYDALICTLTPEEAAVKFNDGYGGPEGQPFTAWSEKRVYFPICYDGAEWVGSVSRHPDGQPTEHQGGG